MGLPEVILSLSIIGSNAQLQHRLLSCMWDYSVDKGEFAKGTSRNTSESLDKCIACGVEYRLSRLYDKCFYRCLTAKRCKEHGFDCNAERCETLDDDSSWMKKAVLKEVTKCSCLGNWCNNVKCERMQMQKGKLIANDGPDANQLRKSSGKKEAMSRLLGLFSVFLVMVVAMH